MVHEKTAPRGKQPAESTESGPSDAGQGSSSRPMKDKRRVSIIPTEIFGDEPEDAKIPYHVRNVAQLKYWLKKDEDALIKAWVDIRDESTFVINEYNKKVMKFDEFSEEYNDRIDELNDAKLMIRELKVELREKNLGNPNIPLPTTEGGVTVPTSKKLPDPPIFTDGKDPTIDDWLSAMRNKLEGNADWFPTDVQQKAYVRTRIGGDAMKHLTARFFKDSIKPYTTADEIFDDLYQIFGDPNRRTNALKAYRRLKQVGPFRDFNTFWAEFQRLASDSELYNQEALLEDLKDKMSYELQKALATESYKATDLHEFAKMCRYTDQTLRDVDNKSRNTRGGFGGNAGDAARGGGVTVTVNPNQGNQNNDRSTPRPRFGTPGPGSNPRATTQPPSGNQVNSINCYNCGKPDHYSRNCRQPRKMNPNSFVREMDVYERDDSPSQEKNPEIESGKD